jgi:hypothetical protein
VCQCQDDASVLLLRHCGLYIASTLGQTNMHGCLAGIFAHPIVGDATLVDASAHGKQGLGETCAPKGEVDLDTADGTNEGATDLPVPPHAAEGKGLSSFIGNSLSFAVLAGLYMPMLDVQVMLQMSGMQPSCVHMLYVWVCVCVRAHGVSYGTVCQPFSVQYMEGSWMSVVCIFILVHHLLCQVGTCF